MLRDGNTKELLHIKDARAVSNGRKLIFVITDKSNMSDLEGYIYKISDSIDSFGDICSESDKLRDQGTDNVIIGDYYGGGRIGVQS